MKAGIPAVIVDTGNSLQPSGGGVQVCNREHLDTLEVAGFAVKKVPFDLDRRIATRIANRLRPKLRPGTMPPGLVGVVGKAITDVDAQYVFFGLTRFEELSRQLRDLFPRVKQVLLSHGTESIDFFIEQKIRRKTGTEKYSRSRVVEMLGEEILREGQLRQYIDAAIVLSPFEVELEKWLGTPAVLWSPRTINEPSLKMAPIDGRVGCVATLDHPPNYDGLEHLFEALVGKVSKDFRFRIIGRPEKPGIALTKRYPFVEYLGSLDDQALRKEVAMWCCFVNPIFVNAKGCSTKLAMALGWELPIATTEYGVRGYRWNASLLPFSRTPESLAQAVLERSRLEEFERFRAQTLAIVAQTPSRETVAGDVGRFLLDLT